MEQPGGRVLVVDDDPEIRLLIRRMLEADGYEIRSCPSGKQALEMLARERFQVILCDIRLPDISGIELLLHVRRLHLETEVILMTAYASVQTAVQALRGEAFDYLLKPFSMNQLRQGVRQAMRAQSPARRLHVVAACGDLTIDQKARRVWIGEREVRLTRLEFDLLAYLFQYQGYAVSRQELLREVWHCGDQDERSDDTVKSCIRRLRKKLGDDAQEPHYIQNVWGVGYQLGE